MACQVRSFHRALYSLLTASCLLPSALAQGPEAYRKERLRMVEERVAREGIRNEAVLNAIKEVPRHLFVAPKFQPEAYSEKIIDIGHKQTLSTAYIVAYMTEAIDPQPTDKV